MFKSIFKVARRIPSRSAPHSPEGGPGSEAGSVAVVFAISLVPLIVMIGAAVDYQRAVAARARLQIAVDAAVLAAVKAPTPSERIALARTILASNVSDLNVDNLAQVFTNNPDGSFTGTASGSTPAPFMGVVNVNAVKISATSKAALGAGPPSTPTSLTLTVNSVKGWFRKDVTLWIHRPGDATDTALATFVYQPTSLFNSGTGTTGGPLGSAIPLGTNYDKLYLTMQVYPDGCGPNQAPEFPDAIDYSDQAYWEPYSCIPVSPPGVVKQKTPYSLSTIDPTTSNHLFVDGVRQPLGAPLNVTNFAKCNATVTHGWEDTRTWEPSNPDNVDAWKTQDLIFNVVGGPCATNTAMTSATGTSVPRLLN